jgi:hypothetical protein
MRADGSLEKTMETHYDTFIVRFFVSSLFPSFKKPGFFRFFLLCLFISPFLRKNSSSPRFDANFNFILLLHYRQNKTSRRLRGRGLTG